MTEEELLITTRIFSSIIDHIASTEYLDLAKIKERIVGNTLWISDHLCKIQVNIEEDEIVIRQSDITRRYYPSYRYKITEPFSMINARARVFTILYSNMYHDE